MKIKIFKILFLIVIFIPSNIFGQISPLNQKNVYVFEVDSLKENEFQIVFKYTGIFGVPAIIIADIEQKNFNAHNLNFVKTTFNLSAPGSIIVPLKLTSGFSYSDIANKAIFLKLDQMSPILNSSIVQITFVKKKELIKPIEEYFKLNVGSNFDYLQSNPFKLLYLDANIMAPNAFKLKIRKSLNYFGLYGRIYQFQGISQTNQLKPINYSDSLGINGVPKIIKYLNKDSLLINQPKIFQKYSENINRRNYGMAFGLTRPLISDTKNNFYLSFGIHFEGILSLYESDIINTEILNDTIKVSRSNYLKNYNNIILDKRRSTSFTNTIGISFPIIWRFSSFELKVLPATSIFKTDLGSLRFSNTGKLLPSYSIHASLSEIKQTGFNIGCEIRGFYNLQPTTFSIFVAKIFNLDKLGDFLKI